MGNWTHTDQNGSAEDRIVNDDNEYASITGMTPAYDSNGNLTSDGTKDYVYDWLNRLVEVKVTGTGQTIAECTYDALNRRISKFTTSNSQLTTYIYDDGQVIEEYVDSVLERVHVHGAYIDDPIMTGYEGQDYFYLKDRQYSVTVIADANGSIIETYEYTAFGLMKILDTNGVEITESQIGNAWGYTGRRWDKESGLWYYRNRMYSPTLGRFLQRDPAGYVDGMNLYAYVQNNPLKYLDPMGLTTMNQQPNLASYVRMPIPDEQEVSRFSNSETGIILPVPRPGSSTVFFTPTTDGKIEVSERSSTYRAEMAGTGGGLGGYVEVGTYTLYDDTRMKAYDYKYVAFGGGYVVGGSAQPEVGLAYGSSNPQDWAGWGSAVNVEGISPGFSGGGGQVAWSGGNVMYTSGPHAGTPGGSAVYVSTYTWYLGERRQ